MGAGTHATGHSPTDRWPRKSIDRPVPTPSMPSGEETCQAQRLAHRPRLERAAARRVRRGAGGEPGPRPAAPVVGGGEERRGGEAPPPPAPPPPGAPPPPPPR